MLNITLSFDPSSDADIDYARRTLDRLSGSNAPAPVDPEAIEQKIIALLRGYGPKRTEYIRHIATASPGRAQYEDLVAIVGSPKAIGGTHSAIERAWRAKGMPGPFIDTDTNGDAVMSLLLADIVLRVLHEMSEPDPLAAARF